MLFSSLFNFSHQRVKRWRPRTIVNSSKRLWQSTTTRYEALFMFLELCFNVSAISRMNYWWACWLKYAWNWRTQKKPGRWRHISIPNATNSMNKLLSFVSRRHQRFVQKAVVSEIKAARVFASGRNDLLIRKHGTEHARNPSGTSHWYQHPANQHPEQVSHQRLALFKFYSRVSVFPSIYVAHANIAAREHLPA